MAALKSVKVIEWPHGGSMWITGNRANKDWNKLGWRFQKEAQSKCQGVSMNGPGPPERSHWVKGCEAIVVLKIHDPRWRLFGFQMGNEWHIGSIVHDPKDKNYATEGDKAAEVRRQLTEVRNAV